MLDKVFAALEQELDLQEEDAKWEASFARSHGFLQQLTYEGRAEYRAGETDDFDAEIHIAGRTAISGGFRLISEAIRFFPVGEGCKPSPARHVFVHPPFSVVLPPFRAGCEIRNSVFLPVYAHRNVGYHKNSCL